MESSLPKKERSAADAVPLSVARAAAPAIERAPDKAQGDDRVERLRQLELENHRLQLTVRRLRQLAFVDGLTGLANRRHFNLVLKSEIRRARRDGAPLALMLCDLDKFKRINDSLGHQAGDDVLCMISHLLHKACRRAGDLAARYGGEEFALLLPGVCAGEAPEIAARLCREIATSSIICRRPAGTTRVTASFGVSVMDPGAPCMPRDLITAADIALYEAKNAGRNCVRFNPIDSRAN